MNLRKAALWLGCLGILSGGTALAASPEMPDRPRKMIVGHDTGIGAERMTVVLRLTDADATAHVNPAADVVGVLVAAGCEGCSGSYALTRATRYYEVEQALAMTPGNASLYAGRPGRFRLLPGTTTVEWVAWKSIH